jgi:hypothetical protein
MVAGLLDDSERSARMPFKSNEQANRRRATTAHLPQFSDENYRSPFLNKFNHLVKLINYG